MQAKALLVTEDGSVFQGYSIGVPGWSVGEVVFNTASTGYQEILSDPSYAQQFITFTHTHIGNVGINRDDAECQRIWAKGAIINELSPMASNWRSEQSLADWLKANEVVAIAGVDTRRLTRLIRQQGALKACLVTDELLTQGDALAKAKAFPGLLAVDLAKEVTTASSYTFDKPSWFAERADSSPSALSCHVVAYDFGVKQSILHQLVDRGATVTVVPAQTSASEVLALKPDGVFLSNGPGDPEPCDYAIKAIKQLLDHDLPIFGICLGHQLLALALGAKTVKMKFGHHGGNHPVQDLSDGRVLITSQNHGFAVDEASLPKELQISHRSLFDGTIQGLRHVNKAVFSFQGHPEAGPGPLDVWYLFDDFIRAAQEK